MRARSSILLACAVLGFTVGVVAQPREPSPDARIHYYRQRLGGRATYPAYARLGLAYADKAWFSGRTEYYLDAGRYLEQSLAMQRSYEALLGLAVVSTALHRFPEAVGYATESAASNPGDPAALGALFDAQRGHGKDAEAEHTLAGIPPQSFEHAIRLATVHEGRGEVTAALRGVERACALPETAAAPALTRAWCEVRMGALRLAACEPEKARAHYARASSIVPGYFLAREHLAELDAAEGRTRHAMEQYRILLFDTPEPRYRLELAALHDLAGEADEADAERRRARAELLRRAADDVRDAWPALVELEAEDTTTAESVLRWAEEDWRNRQDVHAAGALAWAAFRRGDVQTAATHIDRAIGSASATPTILLHGATIRLRRGDAEGARALLARALDCTVALTPGERRLAARVRDELPR